MRVLKILSLVGAMIAGASTANAVPVTAGPTVNLTAVVTATQFQPEFDFTDFMVGETIDIRVVMSGPITRSGGANQTRYFASAGAFIFEGQTSETVLAISTGVQAFARAGLAYFRSIDETGIWVNRFTDIELNGDEFGTSATFEEFLAQFTGGQTGGNKNSRIRTDTGIGLTFNETTVIPLPAGGVLLLGGLGALALRRKIAA